MPDDTVRVRERTFQISLPEVHAAIDNLEAVLEPIAKRAPLAGRPKEAPKTWAHAIINLKTRIFDLADRL